MTMTSHQLSAALSRLKRVHLAQLPTPLQRLNNLEQELQYSGLYIKRDDLTGLGPGGNKLRCLEFILGDALAQDSTVVVVAGPVQSNLCVLTAVACAKLKIPYILVFNGDKPAEYQGNQLLNRLLNADMRYLGPVSNEERTACTDLLCEELAVQGERPYLVRNGATSGHGALGYVNAIPELIQQCREQDIGLRHIFVPGGNGGISAGLIFGNALLGCPFQIQVISVEFPAKQLRTNIEQTITEIEPLLELSFPGDLGDGCSITEQYRGGGWGFNTPESTDMTKHFPQLEGIFLENIYNSKVFVGLTDMVRQEQICGDAAYIHTGGFSSLFAQPF